MNPWAGHNEHAAAFAARRDATAVPLARILVIEDEFDLAQLLKLHLRDLHASVTLCSRGDEGMRRALENAWSLVVLDLSLPDCDGLEICARLRRQDRYTPVLMLTARSAEHDRVLGLDTGADDYLTKPFGIAEFTARCRALLRRVHALNDWRQADASSLTIADIELSAPRHEVRRSGELIETTAREFDLLAFLMRNAGQAYSRAQLLDHVWGVRSDAYEHTVSSHINRLRAKIELNPAEPRYLLTVWGIGYRFAES
jgi:two-component system OmpR family response regulator